MIAIVDYNMGNLQSVKNAFEKIGKKVELVSDGVKIRDYDKIILPGVGAFGDAMEHLREFNMDEALVEVAKTKPILGICLGMQLLFSKSYEFGEHKGLDLIKGEVVKFDKDKVGGHKIPQMGWNRVFAQHNSPLFANLPEELYLYFVHSYHIECDEKYIIGKTTYGYEFASAVQRENIFGFQPHPEKSHDNGLKILENFIGL